MKFSEKLGYTSVKDIVQLESMDSALRNGLWSLLQIYVWNNIREPYHSHTLVSETNRELKALLSRLCLHYFKHPLDTLTDNWKKEIAALREYFFAAPWFEVYDFVEFVADNYGRRQFKGDFLKACNSLLEREISAYRFVDGVLCRITEKEQIDEVERALNSAQGPVRAHLQRALELLSSRDAPDYRNSIKESISAVESLVSLILKSDKGTLGQLLKKLEDEFGLHPALKTSFSNLYGYASDEGGIRHAMLELPTLKFEDALFFLVACSGFVSYVQSKTAVSSAPP